MLLITKSGGSRYNSSKVIACTSPFLANFGRLCPKWPWKSRSNVTICNLIRELSKMLRTANFGSPGYNPSKVIASTSPFSADFDHFWPKWPGRSRSNVTICNPIRELSKMHLTAKFGSPSYNPSKVIASTNPFSVDFESFWPKWPWRSRSNVTICNPVRELSKMHITAKFGSPSLAAILQKLLGVQACFRQILTVFGPNDLEGQGQMSPYAIPSENFSKYTYKPNLGILVTLFQKLLWVQAKSRQTDGRTDIRTDAGDRNTPRPYWPRGKNRYGLIF